MTETRPLWKCPQCAREFANRNQSHACGRYTLDQHFAGKPDYIRRIFDAFVAAVRRDGPVRILPEKTRIAFQIRMSFAQLTPRKAWVDGHLVFARRVESPRFRAIQTISRRNHVHAFRLTSASDVDAELCDWIREARAVGAQHHFVIRDGPGGSGIDRCVPAMSTETEHSAINRVRESLVAAVNRSDAAAASQLWTADSRMMPPNQPTLQGRIAIHAHFARLFTQLRFQYTLSNCELQVFGTMAVERIEYHVITHSIADGSATEDRGKGLHVYRRDADGQWRIFADIWNSDRGPESRQA